jgi:septum formation protein
MKAFVYLASHSPRRRELLRQINVRFETLLLRTSAHRSGDVPEGTRPGEAPIDYVARIARAKAEVGATRARQRGLPPAPVLAADTEVVIDGVALGKPADAAQAAAMLRRLSGREHEVLSAVAVSHDGRLDFRLSRTTVRMRELQAAEIRRYVESGEPFDKAGGYAIQGSAAAFVERIDGSYSGVMGLPLYETAELLRALGQHLP